MCNWLKRLFEKKPKDEGQVQSVGIPRESLDERLVREAKELAQDKIAKSKPGPFLIGRQGGQKRNKVHFYVQPMGYPIRLCDWRLVEEKSIEIIGQLTNTVEKKVAALAFKSETSYQNGNSTGCSHCRAILEGKRGPIMVTFEGEPE